MNQEIKRVLTEVLLKVCCEINVQLFSTATSDLKLI